MTDDFNWEILGKGLSSVLTKYDLELAHIAKTKSRLEYVDFEKIFYHLFQMIDQSETRRKFWSIFPARNQDERNKFLNNAILFINDRNLGGKKMSVSQLRTHGGEPFRRILASLIGKAADVEIAAIEKKIGRPVVPEDASLSQLMELRDEKRAILQQRMDELETQSVELNALQETLANLKQDNKEKWAVLGEEGEFELSKLKSVYKSLLNRLETSNARRKAATQKIMEIPMPTDSRLGPDATKPNTPRRVSNMVREMRDYLTLSPECTPESEKTRLVAKITQKLKDYDDHMNELIDHWRDEQDKADEKLLESEEMQERYRYFEKLIPKIELRPIALPEKRCATISK